MTDILLVVPSFNYGKLQSVGPKCPNIGIGTVAAFLEVNGYNVAVLDCFGLELEREEIKKELAKHNARIVMTGSATANFTLACEILQDAKALNPKVITIHGGPHVSGNPESAFEDGNTDYVVIGEGEETCLELVNWLSGKTDAALESILGIVYKKDGKIVRNPDRDIVKNLDKLPVPAYHLFPMERYHSYGWLDMGRKFTTMVTSRGCPFKCFFCVSSIKAKYWRQKSADLVFKEILLLYKEYGIRHIYFQDDEFCVNHARVIEICNKIREHKLDLVWECLTRVNHMDDQLLSNMASAGCVSILFGVETGYEEGLKLVNKPIELEMVVKATRMAQKYGIMVKCTYIMGFPWEGAAELKKTINFAKRVDADLTFFNIAAPYPGTPFYDEVVKYNLFEQPENYSGHIIHGAEPLLRTRKLTSSQLNYWVGRAMLEFYMRPSYILRKLRRTKGWQDFKRNFSSGNNLLQIAVKKTIMNHPWVHALTPKSSSAAVPSTYS